MAGKTKKCKRYNGRPYNVKENIFFENYMEEVSKGGTVSPSSHFPYIVIVNRQKQNLGLQAKWFPLKIQGIQRIWFDSEGMRYGLVYNSTKRVSN